MNKILTAKDYLTECCHLSDYSLYKDEGKTLNDYFMYVQSAMKSKLCINMAKTFTIVLHAATALILPMLQSANAVG